MNLTKADLAKAVYQNHEMLTLKQSNEAVETILKLCKESLIEGSDVLLSGFGKFNVRDKEERLGRKSQTGESLILDSRRVVTFRASGLLREKINR